MKAADKQGWGFRFKSLTFSDGNKIELTPDSAVLIVGPNNAGKSLALREIVAHLQPPHLVGVPMKVVLDIEIELSGTATDLRDWLDAHAFRVQRELLHFQRPGANTPWSVLKQEWEDAMSVANSDSGDRIRLPGLAPFVIFHAAAEQRLGLLGESAVYNPLTDGPGDPLQVLFARPELEAELSEDSQEAFDVGVVLARIWGAPLRLHMGSLEIEPATPPSRAYIDAIEQLPLASEQGDGIRSFLGLILALRAAGYPVVMVDEPEAFLHPPQARLLGRKLVSIEGGDTQAFIATHNSDVLRGALDATDANVQVIRVVRNGDVNTTAVLSPERLREIWSDPLLRYSNVLEGLFHKGVVISEGDADSRFYSAVLDAIRDAKGAPPHDLLFTQSGGKERLPTILEALTSLSVPAAVVVDFDGLRDEALLRRLTDLQGGNWSDLAQDWRAVYQAIEQLGSAPVMTDVKRTIDDVFQGASNPKLDRATASKVRDAVQLSDSWRLAKRSGLGLLPQGSVSEAGQRLLDTLAALGIFVVPVGELERWVPDISEHGPRWVGAVLQGRRYEEPDAPAWEFMRAVSAYFESSRR